jgi:hypothetical protein
VLAERTSAMAATFYWSPFILHQLKPVHGISAQQHPQLSQLPPEQQCQTPPPMEYLLRGSLRRRLSRGPPRIRGLRRQLPHFTSTRPFTAADRPEVFCLFAGCPFRSSPRACTAHGHPLTAFSYTVGVSAI